MQKARFTACRQQVTTNHLTTHAVNLASCTETIVVVRQIFHYQINQHLINLTRKTIFHCYYNLEYLKKYTKMQL